MALGLWADVGALLLIAFLIPTSFMMHAFSREEDPQTQQMQMAMFMKNVALTGGALIILSSTMPTATTRPSRSPARFCSGSAGSAAMEKGDVAPRGSRPLSALPAHTAAVGQPSQRASTPRLAP